MILWILGGTASGKSTICYKVIENLGVGYKGKVGNIPYWTFTDILVVGRHIKSGYVLNGLDGVMATQKELMKFIDNQVGKYNHILLEGNKSVFVTKETLDHLMQYDLKLYYLKADLEEMKIRSNIRNNGHDKTMTMPKMFSELTKLNKVIHAPEYKDYLELKENSDMEQSNIIADEIVNVLEPNTKASTLIDMFQEL
jgi:hypothetical protein